MDPVENSGKFRRVVVLIGISGLIVFGLLLIVADAADDGLDPSAAIVSLAILLLSMGPFLLYRLLLKTFLVSVLVGLAMLAATVGMYTAFFISESGTAGILVINSALINYGLVIVGALVDRARRLRDL